MPINTKKLYYIMFDEPHTQCSFFCGVFDSRDSAAHAIKKECLEYDVSPSDHRILPLEINKWV